MKSPEEEQEKASLSDIKQKRRKKKGKQYTKERGEDESEEGEEFCVVCLDGELFKTGRGLTGCLEGLAGPGLTQHAPRTRINHNCQLDSIQQLIR